MLTALAPGKVNLGLFLGPTREDGLHELVSLVQPVSLADKLTLAVAAGSDGDVVECPGVEGPNLAARALAALREETGWDGPPVRIRIEKRIPVAAGMGGGSADAAATLRLAMQHRGQSQIVAQRFGSDPIVALAFRLGSDVPALLAGGPVLVTGAGEGVERVVPRAAHGVLVLPSAEKLSTPDVFREADRLGLKRPAELLEERLHELRAALAEGAHLPADLLVNDLEPAARSLCPSIGEALDAARSAGAAHALVSGSGPTVVGLFPGEDGPERAEQAAERIPGAVAAMPVDAEFAAVREA